MFNDDVLAQIADLAFESEPLRAGVEALLNARLPRSAAGRVPMPDEVLTIKEVTVLLKLADKTVYSMAQQGDLPAFKLRGQWRMRKGDFDRWLPDRAENRSDDRKGSK